MSRALRPRMPRRGLAGALGLVVALLAVLAPAGAAAAQDGAPTADRQRVLVLSLPTLAWGDLHRGRTPQLDALLDDSAVAALSVRLVGRTTNAADGYASLGAGTRARGIPSQSGHVLEPQEDFFGVPAGSVFRRNTGEEPGGGVVALAQPALARANARLDFDAEVGALGQALEDAGVPRAVIANADGRYALGSPTFDREGGSALVDASGVVPDGAVSRALVEEDPLAPFGVRYDQTAVLEVFDGVWAAGGVVLVEGSDLARVDRYRTLATPDQQARLRADALARTDALIGALLERVDLDRDAVLVVAPYHSSAGTHLTVAGLHAPGVEPGLLRSASTRRTGVVTAVDVAPTILDLVDVERPGSMEGRAFERAAQGAATGRERAEDLAELNAAARFRDRQVVPVATAFVVLQALLLVAATVVYGRFTRFGRGGSQVVAFGAVAMLGFLPATYLTALLPFHEASDAAYYAFIAVVALVLAAAATIAGRRHRLDPLLLGLGSVFGYLVVDMLLGAPTQLNTVFGYSPTVGGRFAGMGNLAFGQFAGAAFLLAGLFLLRLERRRTAVAVALGVLGLAVVIDGSPIWGSDVGGVLALVPAIGVVASRVLDVPIRARTLLLWGGATLAAISTFAAIDLARPADERTHLGRLVESVTDEGWDSFATVVARKLGANLGVLTSTIWTAMVPLAIALAGYLLWRAPGAARAIRRAIPDSLLGLVVVGFLGFALNDSGIAVPGIMIGVINATLVYLTVRGLDEDADAAPAPADPAVAEAPA